MQEWSTVAFGGLYRQRYGVVLSSALCILAYAPQHASLLRSLGYPCVHEVPLFSLPVTSSPPPPSEQGTANASQLDFTFFGGCSPRRGRILRNIRASFALCDSDDGRDAGQQAGVMVAPSLGGSLAEEGAGGCFKYMLNCVGWENAVFDAVRQRQVQGSRLVINIHTDEQSVLEAHRLNYLLGQGSCVLSERSDDAELDKRYAAAVHFVASGDEAALHEGIRWLLNNATALKQCREQSLALYESLMANTTELRQAVDIAITSIVSKV